MNTTSLEGPAEFVIQLPNGTARIEHLTGTASHVTKKPRLVPFRRSVPVRGFTSNGDCVQGRATVTEYTQVTDTHLWLHCNPAQERPIEIPGADLDVLDGHLISVVYLTDSNTNRTQYAAVLNHTVGLRWDDFADLEEVAKRSISGRRWSARLVGLAVSAVAVVVASRLTKGGFAQEHPLWTVAAFGIAGLGPLLVVLEVNGSRVNRIWSYLAQQMQARLDHIASAPTDQAGGRTAA